MPTKQSWRNHYQLFNTVENQELMTKHHHLSEIEQALINNELTLYYQPKVNMLTEEVFGAEALIRWIHPTKGLIPPVEFLPTIDGTELEIKIGDWVANQAIKQMDSWLKQGIKLEVSINISSLHLQSKNFIERLGLSLAKYPNVNSEYLQLEILESSALGDLQMVSQIIKTCQQVLGVNIALDDFGTGYSSLTHLRSLSANTIKIDQSFIRDMLDDPNDFTILDGIIGLADSFGLKVIAEGVESTEHGLMLLMTGCHYAQGYSISKPIPASEFSLWLSHYQANKSRITCGNKKRTRKENKIKLFRLIANQWKKQFSENLLSALEKAKYWPLMRSSQCHCGYWIKREMQDELFAKDNLLKLSKEHDICHDVALALLKRYSAGEIELAREGLPQLLFAFDELDAALELCL